MKRFFGALPAVLISLFMFTSPAQAASCSTSPLSKGSKGDCVKQLQQKLSDYRCNPGNADGTFGARTDSAVRSFQAANKLKVDGIVGPATWKRLNGVPTACANATGVVATGRRIEVDRSKNWVYLYDAAGALIDSGGMVDNPDTFTTGSYEVCRRLAVNTDKSRKWQLNNFVGIRPVGSSECSSFGVGFHEIPIRISDGTRMHSEKLLGTDLARSHGCFRLGQAFAAELWAVASVGTLVIVT